ncbi:epimerase [Stenotrophomonas sp. ZAC14D2_NAIMI4_7]|uniref:NAD-dependent epimerase/dehydratase family protein n=1 Tax=Stenotrophomonas sp. ZAC14D2_NAIMI4_7 TaxID=2072405 RepID=UPI000D540D24|nr:NAD-dependent epimerase/dehydratase family protein [Stenotrophomonas sp. ZAC14D2_NAIMI4_7]AWH19060.1 epimerase [Stenotrophomonas sp. ZAC14D2_NAIMI4_7]
MSSSTLFLTGGSGYVGRNLIRRLCADGHHVRALVRSDQAAATVQALGAQAVHGDLLDPGMAAAMSGCAALIHAAADTDHRNASPNQWQTNVEGTRNALTAARSAGVPVAIVLSSESALTSGAPLQQAREDHPYPARAAGTYGASKAEAERVALALSTPQFAVKVLRPRFVWGRDNTTAMPYLLQAVRSGRFAWIDGGHYLTSATHVDNLAEAVCCALNRGAGARIYHVCDGAPVPFRRLIGAQLLAHGVQPPDKQVPRALLRVFVGLDDLFRALRLPLRAPMTRQEFASSAVEVTLDDSRARSELGYRPVLTLEAGIALLKTQVAAQE